MSRYFLLKNAKLFVCKIYQKSAIALGIFFVSIYLV